MSSWTCAECGFETIPAIVSGGAASCPHCDTPFPPIGTSPPVPDTVLPVAATTDQADLITPPEDGRYTFRFSGTAAEYFRIWIVNTLLTIVTLGIYAAWAKVRNRQYLYANTHLAGHAFDYLANPVALLRGNLILAGGLLLYGLSDYFFTPLSGMIVAAFYLIFPWLIYKSLRFKAHNSAWRNLRFRFLGDVGDSYLTFLLMPIAIPFTLGILYPYWVLTQRRYFFRNMAFGQSRNRFDAKAGPFYVAYLIAFLVGIVLVTVLFGVGGSVVGLMDFEGVTKEGQVPITFILIGAAFFLLWQLAISSLQQLIYARTMNHCWQSSALGPVRFESRLHGGRLLWIRFSNILAILGSCGLLGPWARIRRTRYLLSCLTVVTQTDLDSFMAATETDDNALGDVASDAFDFEIGL